MGTTSTAVFDAIKTKLEALAELSDYKQLENPFIPEDNATHVFQKAFGVAFGAGLNPELIVKPESTCIRDFNIVLLNKFISTGMNVDKNDDLQKDIMLDMDAIKKCFDDDPQLGGICAKAALLTDTGVGFIDSDRGKFLISEGSLEVTFFEV